METKSPKLLDQVRDTLRIKHYSYRTEQAYVDWIKRLIFFHGQGHSKDLEEDEVQAFITWFANER